MGDGGDISAEVASVVGQAGRGVRLQVLVTQIPSATG